MVFSNNEQEMNRDVDESTVRSNVLLIICTVYMKHGNLSRNSNMVGDASQHDQNDNLARERLFFRL